MDTYQSNHFQSIQTHQPYYEQYLAPSIIFKEEYQYQQFIPDEIIYPWQQCEAYDNQIQIPKTPRKKRKKQLNYEKKRVNKQKNKKINQPIPFSFYEDQAIFNHVFQFGPKFQKISKLFPGRTDSMVKNRYYKTLRYQWEMFEHQYIFPTVEIVKPPDNNLEETSNCNDFNLKHFLEQ